MKNETSRMGGLEIMWKTEEKKRDVTNTHCHNFVLHGHLKYPRLMSEVQGGLRRGTACLHFWAMIFSKVGVAAVPK